MYHEGTLVAGRGASRLSGRPGSVRAMVVGKTAAPHTSQELWPCSATCSSTNRAARRLRTTCRLLRPCGLSNSSRLSPKLHLHYTDPLFLGQPGPELVRQDRARCHCPRHLYPVTVLAKADVLHPPQPRYQTRQVALIASPSIASG
jgi:hypothetical protein